MPTTGRILATCVTRQLQRRTAAVPAQTGIDKGAVDGVVLTPLGVDGDRVLDTRYHGGIDKAVYAYSEADARWWADELDVEIPPGRFGENLRIEGIEVTGAVIGERWRIGEEVIVEVSEPRVPCSTFQHHMGFKRGWVRRFSDVGRVGTYLRVLTGGAVAAGDVVEVVHTPAHGVTIGRWFTDPSGQDGRALLAAETGEWQMAAALRSSVTRALG